MFNRTSRPLNVDWEAFSEEEGFEGRVKPSLISVGNR